MLQRYGVCYHPSPSGSRFVCNALNVYIQALQDAAAIDAKAANGSDITPLCGLPLAVKDAIDVVG